MDNILTIVVPCFNEEEVLPETLKELGAILIKLKNKELISNKSKILFVDDGSKDKTWNLIEKYTKELDYVGGIKFSRNYGHQNALIAGMTEAVEFADMIITIDADLQDDVNAIPEMIQKYLNGVDVVYGVRNNRDTDTVFKRRTALLFYQLMKKIGVKLVPNSADYRLLSKRAVQALLQFKERNLFLRGIVPLVGYKSDKVYYARKDRFAGTSKYPLKKMIHFAMDGITSFSLAPIHLIFGMGTFIVLIGILLMIYSIFEKFTGHVTSGWSSLMISIWLIGGVQLISLSVIGDYIGKIFTEVKKRPRFTIEKIKFNEKFKQ
ncbi:glycosyltransferase family 2 protein [Pediococcus pentosaceus]|uniref:glycosyltransferase family 2 protein n=1 Tax=Pediococcus pentosaceus TaxID=1255 RepID=UPI00211CE7A6|nr:glycosyltransferase family 2 protein [Pediococcus pentosaceus]MCQ9316556.1 glycosyltransferase family 2 protein [Pediococcus pentosaceus]MCQ9339045.1 glycosyltransferase family 2 protein [Pediococcus pentosaceus]